MTVSRWKVMAGVLGASLGGLAAIAGQAPKIADTRSAEPPESPLTEKIKPAGPATPPLDVAPPTFPAGKTLAVVPTLTEPPVAVKPAVLPKPEVVPASGFNLPLPVVPAGGPAPQLPPLPGANPVVEPPPVPLTNAGPAIPPSKVEVKAEPVAPVFPPLKSEPSAPPTASAPVTIPPNFQPPVLAPATNAVEPAAAVRSAPAVVPAAVAAASKFRILLRVGEGEPQFEVRTGDDLMMKVVCEKVDVASAEKGQTGQQVKAAGRVRFAGFGSEGTCDELSFVAGTGELMLTGNVTIQMKDKLGRVDSELKSDKVKYKLDASAMPGVMKP